MPEIKLACSCGQVQGLTTSVNAKSGTRIKCCCDDCQAFAKYLNQQESVLDQYGATDIFQMPISSLKITEGIEQIACVRLTSKGMYRWYTNCCNTPIGNTFGAAAPFIGVIHSFMKNTASRDTDLGKSRAYIQAKFANQKIAIDQQGSAFWITVRIILKLTLWKVLGQNKPSAFFNEEGQPIAEPNVLK